MKLFRKYAKVISITALALFLLASCDDDDDNDSLPAPTANFTTDIDAANLTVRFTNNSENATSFAWDFGDGNSSTEQNPTHTYDAEGTYPVTLTASNADNDPVVFTDQIEVIVPDTEAPVITLIGDAVINLTVGETYEELGATASDLVDGEVTVDIDNTAVNTNVAGTYEVIYTAEDSSGNSAEVRRTVNVTEGGGSDFDSGLLTNGDFGDDGDTIGGDDGGWFGDGEIRTEGGNSFYFANPTSAGNPWDVNLSQVVAMTEGTTYTLSFEVSTGAETDGRTIVAGIGLNEGEFPSVTETIALTTTPTVHRLTLAATGFGGANSRVLFDMGAEVGVVVIDDVSLMVDDSGADVVPPVITLIGDAVINLTVGETYEELGATASDLVDGEVTVDIDNTAVNTNVAGTYEVIYTAEDSSGNSAEVRRTVNVTEGSSGDDLIVNGDFESGSDPWFGAVEIRTEGGNSFYFANPTSAGDPWAVNLSQVVAMTEGTTYTLSFEVSTGAETDGRTIVAGIGLNEGEFPSVTETIALTTTPTVHTLTLTATGFGGANSRVLFDMGADVGVVVIDNVSLFVDSSGGGGGGTSGCDGDPVAATALPLDFEGCETFLSTFDDAGLISVQLAENPSKTGINTSDYVLEVNKPTGSLVWAGTQNTFPNNFDLTTTNVFKVKVYSTQANAPIRFELLAIPNEDGIPNPSPVTLTVPNANEWIELEVEFTDLLAGPNAYNHLVFKPGDDNSGTPTTADATYYFDDLELVESDGGDGGGGNEVTAFCNTSVTHFGGDASSEILVSFYNINATTMGMEMTSADENAIDLIDLAPGAWSVTPGFQVAPNDDDADGTWYAELIFPEGTDTIDIYFLWSKVGNDGNWLSHEQPDGRATIDFNQTCE